MLFVGSGQEQYSIENPKKFQYRRFSYVLLLFTTQYYIQILQNLVICCKAQGKGKGRLRNVTQRSFIDYRWWMVDGGYPFPDALH